MTSQSFLLYVLKVSMLSGIFVGYYFLALRNKRFHYFNRFYLLSSLVASLLIPQISINWIAEEQPVFMGYGESMEVIIRSTSQSSGQIDTWFIGLLLMLLVGVLLMGTIAYRIHMIYRLKRRSETIVMHGFDLVLTDDSSAPFSFLNNLFWKKSIKRDDEGGKQIWKHELTHIRQKHTWDRLFAQICCSLFWINPFYWILQKELEAIHEFIADEEAVVHNDTESFAKMLLQAHYGNHFLETKHSFFYSSIKRRLTMLTTTTNIRFSYLRRLMLLPLVMAGISIFSVRVHAIEKIENKMHVFSFQKQNVNDKPIDVLRMQLDKEKGELQVENTGNKTAATLPSLINPAETGLPDTTPKTNDLKLQKESFNKVFTVTQEPPSFPGGVEGWTLFLQKNLNAHKPVDKGAPPGMYKVNLSFIVDRDGDVRDVVAENDPGYSMKEEAIRVMLSSPKWKPAYQNGKTVVYKDKRTITFVISEG